jgi:hypothetical protein
MQGQYAGTPGGLKKLKLKLKKKKKGIKLIFENREKIKENREELESSGTG